MHLYTDLGLAMHRFSILNCGIVDSRFFNRPRSNAYLRLCYPRRCCRFRPVFQFVIALSLITCGPKVLAETIDFQDLNWQLKRDKDDIQIYTSSVPDSKHKAVKSLMTASGSLQAFTALILDAEACPEWADLCKRSEVIEQISEIESHIYTYNDLPFPVSDRDVLAKVRWQFDRQARRVTMNSRAIEGHPKTKAVRIVNARSQWIFTELPDQQIRIEGYAHIDPNGPTPAWLSNMLLVDSPFKTQRAMRKMIAEGRYQDANISFID